MRWCCHVWGICFHQTLINLAADYVLHGEISLRDFPCMIERPLAAQWWLTVQTNSWPPTSDRLDSILIFRYGKQICTFKINVLLKVKNIFSCWEGDVFYTADVSPECSKGGVNEGYLKRLALKYVWGWESFTFRLFWKMFHKPFSPNYFALTPNSTMVLDLVPLVPIHVSAALVRDISNFCPCIFIFKPCSE